jgi:hypothetical protein
MAPPLPEAALAWVSGLFKGAVSTQRLAMPEATRLLMAIGPIMSMAGTAAEAPGLASVADVVDVLDAQEIIREGQAATAALLQNEDLIELQLALNDGTERVITLFKQEPLRV